MSVNQIINQNIDREESSIKFIEDIIDHNNKRAFPKSMEYELNKMYMHTYTLGILTIIKNQLKENGNE